MKTKIPFDQLYCEVDKLFAKKIEDQASIDAHCLLIREFVISCGWDAEEFIKEMVFGNNEKISIPKSN